MKRCPECASGFPDTHQFCERDGTTLVADYWAGDPGVSTPPAPTAAPPVPTPADEERVKAPTPYTRFVPAANAVEVVEIIGSPVSGEARLRENWQILAVIAVAAVALGLAFFIFYQSAPEVSQQNAYEPVASGALVQQQMPVALTHSSPSASESPSPQPSPSPIETPSPVIQAEPTPAATLSSGMVSTGGGERAGHGPMMIRLTNGSKVEADEVWETRDGIWYRRSGIATFLERAEVKTIEKVTEKDSSAPASPSPTPSTSQSIAP